jgi:hypothetical protein
VQAREYATGDAATQRAPAAACAHGSEVFVRDDGGSLLVLVDHGTSPATPAPAALTAPPAPPAPPNVPTPPDSTRALRLLFSGGRFGAAGGDWLFFVGLWTPPDWRDEFLAWYRGEHLPMLLECPVWDGCRFTEQSVEAGCQFHALHQFSDRAALDSEHRRRSRSTHWFARLSRNPWFDGGFTRTLYRRLPPS